MTVISFLETTWPQTETSRGPAATGQSRVGQCGFEEKTMPINAKIRGDRHLENASEFADDSIENRLGFGIEEMQFREGGKAGVSPRGSVPTNPFGEERRQLRIFSRASASETTTPSAPESRRRLADSALFSVGAPHKPTTILTGGIGAHFLTKISRVNDRRRYDN